MPMVYEIHFPRIPQSKQVDLDLHRRLIFQTYHVYLLQLNRQRNSWNAQVAHWRVLKERASTLTKSGLYFRSEIPGCLIKSKELIDKLLKLCFQLGEFNDISSIKNSCFNELTEDQTVEPIVIQAGSYVVTGK